MPIFINQHELTDSEIAAELPEHQDADNPLKSATIAIAIRYILLDEAARLGISAANADATIDAVLAAEVRLPVVNRASCERFYHNNPQRFIVGELVEADHILFQITPNAPLDVVRAVAEQTLAEVLANPASFAERARALSNCPSGLQGGNLGQLSRRQTVPEFEQVLFALPAGEIMPRLLETRFGLHIVRVSRRFEGNLLPFEQVEEQIAEALRSHNRDTAWRQYVQLLVGKARIEGIQLEGADSPLLQ